MFVDKIKIVRKKIFDKIKFIGKIKDVEKIKILDKIKFIGKIKIVEK